MYDINENISVGNNNMTRWVQEVHNSGGSELSSINKVVNSKRIYGVSIGRKD